MLEMALKMANEDEVITTDNVIANKVKELAAKGMKAGVIAKELGLGVAEIRSLI